MVNAAIYRIDWEGIPVRVSSPSPLCGVASELNAGEARSTGMEIETNFHISENLRLDLGA